MTILSEAVLWPIFLVFTAVSVLLLLYYCLVFSRVSFAKPKAKSSFAEKVSVVISARDEYENLKLFLPEVLQQDYPDYEVVVVDDCSDDETPFLLQQLSNEYPHLKSLRIHNNVNFFSGKKFPLSMGIKSASSKYLVLTDADCRPRDNQWLRQMVQGFGEGAQMVLAYGKYDVEKSLVNKLIRFDTLHIGMQFLGMAKAGMPYMGVGRNMAYTKSLFLNSNGFSAHYKIASGDDDLFVQQAGRTAKVHCELHPSAQTLSVPKKRMSDWVNQKRRHISTSKHYRWHHKITLSLYQLSAVLFWLCLIPLVSHIYLWHCVAGLAVLKLLSQFILFKGGVKRLQEPALLVGIPFFEIIVFFVNAYCGIANLFRKPKGW